MDLNLLSLIIGILAYLLSGIIALVMFDMFTGRIRHNFDRSTTDAQIELAENTYTNIILGKRIVKIILLILTWIFWPFVFVGAFSRGKDVSNKKN